MPSFSTIAKRLEVPTSARTTHSIWINDDIRPLPPWRRTWNQTAYISFWAINQLALSNWQLGASLVAVGLSVWQSVISLILGKIIIALVAVFNGYVGAEWHIGFPVLSRFIWGVYGHYLALVQRIVLSVVWFAVQSWTGGLCVQVILASIFSGYQHMPNHFPASANMDTKQFIGWVIFNLLMIPLLYIPPEKIKDVVLYMNIVSAITLISIMSWALAAAHGGGPLLVESSTVHSSSELGWAMVSGVSTVIGGIAVGLTNQPDYCRFARKPGDQVFGQYFSIMFLGTILPVFGCLASSATQAIYGTAIWNPPNIPQMWLDTSYTPGSRAAAFFAGTGLVVAQLAINTIDNAFSAGMDLAGMFPSYLNIRRGAYLGLILSIAACPWELLSTAATFISVLDAYSVFLGPMVGIQVVDYWLIRNRRLKLTDLYHARPEGIYHFWHGLNWRAFVSWTVSWAIQIPGFAHAVTPQVLVPAGCTHLYELAYPLGFTIGFVVHYALNKISPPPGLGLVDDMDYFGTFDLDEARKMGVAPLDDGGSNGSDDGVVMGVDMVAGSEKGEMSAETKRF